jgi:hypothetical protein
VGQPPLLRRIGGSDGSNETCWTRAPCIAFKKWLRAEESFSGLLNVEGTVFFFFLPPSLLKPRIQNLGVIRVALSP